MAGMTDAAVVDLYGDDDNRPGVRYVVRLSRTATGTRTYTVGMTLPETYDPSAKPNALRSDGEAIARLFAIEDAMRLLIEADPAKPRPEVLRRAAPTVHDRTVRVMSVSKPFGTGKENDRVNAGVNGWYTLDELVKGTGASRTQVRTQLHKLVADGLAEVEEGGGKGRQSHYRLVPQ
jgi:hypothetical protein